MSMLFLSSLLFLQNGFTQFSLSEGAKACFGKGYQTGSSIFSDDGTRFAVASSIGLWIYDVFTAQEVALLTNHPSEFTVMVSSPDGNMLASANENIIYLPDTWIPYQLAEPADVSLSIYTADGTVVRTLVLGNQPIGIYQDKSRAAYWDGRNEFGELVASGVYFYTLTAGEYSATRKMLIKK